MTESQSQPKKILVVDDEPNIVKYLESLLADNGYQTVSAANGNEALAMVESASPDLICLDITMPEKSGIRFYRELKDNPKHGAIPVIVVTAVTGYGKDPEPFREFLSTRSQVPPPEEFIAKPIERDSFLEAVARVLAA